MKKKPKLVGMIHFWIANDQLYLLPSCLNDYYYFLKNACFRRRYVGLRLFHFCLVWERMEGMIGSSLMTHHIFWSLLVCGLSDFITAYDGFPLLFKSCLLSVYDITIQMMNPHIFKLHDLGINWEDDGSFDSDLTHCFFSNL